MTDGKGYIFTARSGVGKSTHARLWRELLGDRVEMVNDDKPLIRIDDQYIVYGTPWDGKHHLSNNISVPIKGICILERSENNWIRRIDTAEALNTVLSQTYMPADQIMMIKTLELIDKLMKEIELYKMGCNMDLQAAEMAYEAMK